MAVIQKIEGRMYGNGLAQPTKPHSHYARLIFLGKRVILSTGENKSMELEKTGRFTWWMWALMIAGLAFVLSGFDPVGKELVKIFGPSAGKWATNIIIICLILYVVIRRKR